MTQLIDDFDLEQYKNFSGILKSTKTTFNPAKTRYEFQKIVLNGIKETSTPLTLLQGIQNCDEIIDSVEKNLINSNLPMLLMASTLIK